MLLCRLHPRFPPALGGHGSTVESYRDLPHMPLSNNIKWYIVTWAGLPFLPHLLSCWLLVVCCTIVRASVTPPPPPPLPPSGTTSSSVATTCIRSASNSRCRIGELVECCMSHVECHQMAGCSVSHVCCLLVLEKWPRVSHLLLNATPLIVTGMTPPRPEPLPPTLPS
jgi:hypothetical protein